MEQGDYVALVDDDKEDIHTLRESFQAVVEDMIPVLEYTTGNQIISQVTSFEPLPCMFIIDVHLPDINGLDLIKILQANPNLIHIPIIVLSSRLSPVQLADCEEMGVSVLQKPNTVVGWEELAGKIMTDYHSLPDTI